MNMSINRKILTGEKEQEVFFNLALQGGFNVVELLWSKFRSSSVKTMGFEVPVEVRTNSMSSDVDSMSKIVTAGSWTEFRPDGENRCWAYVIDTPHNRKVMAASLRTGWYKINDQKVREEVKELALRSGLPTDKVEKPITNVKRTAREKAAEKKTVELSDLVYDLKRRLAETEDALKLYKNITEKSDKKIEEAPAIQEKEEPVVRPPLKGVHIDREKIGK